MTKVRWLVLLVIAVVILLVAGSCDPGWGYDVPDTAVEDDFSFVLPSQAGIKFQIWGYLFASNLWMELEVTNQSPFQLSVENRIHDLDPTIKIAVHPIRAGAEDFLGVTVVEVVAPGVFQKAADNGSNPDVLRDFRYARA